MNIINIIWGNKIGDAGIAAIGKALQNNTTLIKLGLGNKYSKYFHR
jgi:hypothetical protein